MTDKKIEEKMFCYVFSDPENYLDVECPFCKNISGLIFDNCGINHPIIS
jgi:phage FluMu protein Com